jgi:very-short-patch-repair endonuclease
MTAQNETRPPPPCGEGAGGEGREAAAAVANQNATTKLGHGWAPAFGEDRQKDQTRTKLRAKRQRKESTPSEKLLWKLLRSVDGVTFRRQPEIGPYVFDFGQYAARLLIEIDGSIHRLPDIQANDRAKTIYAIANGFRVLRFANNDVWDRPAWVVSQVRAALEPTFSLAEKVAAKGPDEGRADEPTSVNAERPSPPDPLSARERGGDNH